MDWGKVTYIFLTLMSLTTTAGFLYEPNIIALFIAGGVNVISTILKIGVKKIMCYQRTISKSNVYYLDKLSHKNLAVDEGAQMEITAQTRKRISNLNKE